MTTPWFPVPNSNYNFIVDPPRLVRYIHAFMQIYASLAHEFCIGRADFECTISECERDALE